LFYEAKEEKNEAGPSPSPKIADARIATSYCTCTGTFCLFTTVAPPPQSSVSWWWAGEPATISLLVLLSTKILLDHQISLYSIPRGRLRA